MAELALGIVGVVPVVLGAITAYKHVTVKVKLFRHSFKEVKRMYKILRTQRQVFSNECLLWLEFVINDSDVASAMASDPGHEGWNDPRLDSAFQSRLKDNYEPWLEVTKEIAEAVHSIENRLEALGREV
ncbi:hypothetical protein K4K54_011938 [Colletotrichum sp. SAR 10_86]|nr:hypothetical protein K4K54_011938 [Colletotrichum sp. SAR 10_86]